MNKTVLQEAIVVVVLSILFAGGAYILRPEVISPAKVTNSTQPQAPFTQLDAEQAHTLFQKGNVLFIDGRDHLNFALGHIPGAINIPLQEALQNNALTETLPPEKTMIVYCSNALCNKAERLAALLSKHGLKTSVFVEGYDAWVANGWETESAQ